MEGESRGGLGQRLSPHTASAEAGSGVRLDDKVLVTSTELCCCSSTAASVTDHLQRRVVSLPLPHGSCWAMQCGKMRQVMASLGPSSLKGGFVLFCLGFLTVEIARKRERDEVGRAKTQRKPQGGGRCWGPQLYYNQDHDRKNHFCIASLHAGQFTRLVKLPSFHLCLHAGD